MASSILWLCFHIYHLDITVNTYLYSIAVLLIRIPLSFHPGSEFFLSRILDPHQIIWVILPKKWFPSSRKYDPGWWSRIRILTFYISRIPDPGFKKGPRIPDPQNCSMVNYNLISGGKSACWIWWDTIHNGWRSTNRRQFRSRERPANWGGPCRGRRPTNGHSGWQ